MSKNKCDMICDLLPLYAENICSEESRNIVTEHLLNCNKCKERLDKMNMSVVVSLDNDISVMKKIKKKIAVKRIIAVIVAVITAYLILAALLFYLMSPVSLQYENNLENYITVDIDSDGNVWVGRTFEANAGFLFPTISDTNDKHFGYDADFDKNSKNGYGFSVKKELYRTISLFDVVYTDWQYSKLFNINEKPEIEYVFYYDTEDNTEHILWEKNNKISN